MDRRLMVFFGICLAALAVFAPTRVSAQAGSEPGDEPYRGEAICLPGVYLQTPDGCLPLGPSETLTTLARQGFSYPTRALPVAKPDASLTQIPNQYARIALEETEAAPVYATLEDAVAGTSPSSYLAAGGTRYISYIQQVDVNEGHYLQLASGGWMRASPAGYSRFQGLIVRDTPRNGFGWVLMETPIYTAPSYNAPLSGLTLYRENQVQVYSTQEAENMNWIMVGPGQWIEDRVVGRITPNPEPPDGVTTDRWIEVNLEEQTMAVYDQRRLVYATLVSTGLEPFYTQPGLFQVYKRLEMETMQGSFEVDRSDFYYLQDVPWTMYYDGARALHGAYWHNFFGYPTSHGCVNLSPGDSHWLFDWAKDGEWVYVWDPSGITPTDPSYYSSSAAW